MVIIGCLRADIVPGDFLMARKVERNTSFSMAVCQVRHVLVDERIEVVWWVEGSAAPPLCPESYENLHRCRAWEVFEDSTSVINQSDVFDVAFVFSADLLEKLWVDFLGMANVFFTRVANHHPFSTDVIESYPQRIWFVIITLQEKLKKLMSYKRQ